MPHIQYAESAGLQSCCTTVKPPHVGLTHSHNTDRLHCRQCHVEHQHLHSQMMAASNVGLRCTHSSGYVQ